MNYSTNRGIALPIIILVIAGILVVAGAYLYTRKYNQIQQPDENQTIVGGDKDIHGCIGSAGYSWCETKQKCLRIWEEKCESQNPSPTPTTSVSPTPHISPAPNLHVYKSSKYGFELSTSLNVGEYSPEHILFSIGGNWPGAIMDVFEIYVLDNSQKMNLNDFIQQTDPTHLKYLPSCLPVQPSPNITSISINGALSIKIGPYCNQNFVIYMPKNNLVYAFYQASGSVNKDGSELMDFISGIKF